MEINTVTIIGRLVKDPEIRNTTNGTPVCNVVIANNESVKKGDNWEDETSFFEVVCFGKQAENCQKYLKKGSQIGVSGKIKQSRWKDKDGKNMSKIIIRSDNIQFLSHNTNNAPKKEEAPLDPWEGVTPPSDYNADNFPF